MNWYNSSLLKFSETMGLINISYSLYQFAKQEGFLMRVEDVKPDTSRSGLGDSVGYINLYLFPRTLMHYKDAWRVAEQFIANNRDKFEMRIAGFSKSKFHDVPVLRLVVDKNHTVND